MEKQNKLAIVVVALLPLLILLMGFTYSIDCATPVGTDSPSTLDDKDRETRYGFAERLNVDHMFALTGTSLSDSATGQHRQVEFYAPVSTPTNAADKGFLYTKDVTAKAELHWLDESNNEIQFTSAGAFNVGLLTSKTITTPTLTSPVLNTGVSGTAVLDEDAMGSDSNTKLATQQSIKAYVDNNVGAAQFTPTAYAGEESVTFPNGLVFKQGYNSGGSNKTVTFDAAFSTAILPGTITITMKRTDLTAQTATYSGETTAGFTIYCGDALSSGYSWSAWGY